MRTYKALEKAASIYLKSKPCHSQNLVYPPHSVLSLGSVSTAPQGIWGTPEQSNSSSQSTMMYLHVLGLLILTLKRIVAENTMQDSLGIYLRR